MFPWFMNQLITGGYHLVQISLEMCGILKQRNENKDDDTMAPRIYNSPTLFGQHVYMIRFDQLCSPHITKLFNVYIFIVVSCQIDCNDKNNNCTNTKHLFANSCLYYYDKNHGSTLATLPEAAVDAGEFNAGPLELNGGRGILVTAQKPIQSSQRNNDVLQ